ncbi:DUF3326 domain-containing protein [Spirulina sp. CS-785/01]|uniref:DUF3326 domain-containing protein n=1 Tax=Spirulina sp. CS-785/01 TaxID=3021716 RepID=UPI00233012C7|nr:DUF3326 domain-containing protein [Spirulina sp. CS-785/01]MDB9311471.1 DUF3326 domain-containing protein [Spirulina sp. CS-785/01]
MTSSPFTVVLLVPTGIGAAIGGYAGDALPVAKALSGVCDRLITHPNVLNGAQLYWPLSNTAYVEGYGLDQFAAGNWGLQPVSQNRIGLLLDAAIEPELRLRHLQAAEATRATLGLDLTDYCLTDQPLGVELRTAPSEASWGTIRNPDSLLRGAEKLRNQARATAIAVVARFPDDPPDSPELQNYRHGSGVDPIAGAEAVISHLVVRQLGIPCAHAPALSPLPVDAHISPRAAAEELGYTFLPCVLVGLSRAPQFIRTAQTRTPEQMWAEQVDAVIVPASACGGSATLSLSHSRIIAVQDNATQMQVPPERLGMKALLVQSYLEALGAIAAYRQGIAPDLLRPHISPLNCLS